MKPSTLGWLFGFAMAATAPVAAQEVAPAAPAAAPAQEAPPPSVTYEQTLDCAAQYELYGGEAEMAKRKDLKKARFASGDKASGWAEQLGTKAGKSADTVEQELAARAQKLLDRPPPVAALRAAAARCDAALGLTTP